MFAVRKNYFDGPIAETYDDDSSSMFDPAVVGATVDFLAELAGDGAALELGIGTGRLALPLSARGVPVCGIDLSPDMVAQLQAKPGAAAIGVTIGDFATTVVEGTFRLAYLVYNTIENLTSQDEQVACFTNVGRHLEPGGCFVIEVEVPPLRRLPPGETALAFLVAPDRLGFDTLDVAHQLGVSHHYWVGEGRARHVRHALSLRLAGRARSHGAPRRDAPARAVERLAPRAVHQRQRARTCRCGRSCRPR